MAMMDTIYVANGSSRRGNAYYAADPDGTIGMAKGICLWNRYVSSHRTRWDHPFCR